MSFRSRFSPHAWVVLPVVAAVLIVWFQAARIDRVERVTALGDGALAAAATDADSPTGFQGGRRQLIIPERNNDSFHWIMQTQQMLAQGTWRLRHVDYDNAPLGRAVHTPSPYRWWLAGVAGVHHLVTGAPIGQSVERAAVYGEPLVHLLLLAAATFLAWRGFGGFAAGMVALGVAGLFPFAGGFLPGVPDPHGWIQAGTLLALLSLATGCMATDFARARRGFMVSGVLGGGLLWLNFKVALTLVLAIAVGALVAAVLTRLGRRRSEPEPALPWRRWALAGATVSLAGFLIEYFPNGMEWTRLGANHPLWSVAWVGIGELLARADGWIRRDSRPSTLRDWLVVSGAVVLIAAGPIAALTSEASNQVAADSMASRLTNLPDAVVAEDLADWISQPNSGGTATATLLPLLILVPAILWLGRRRLAGKQFTATVICLVATATAAGWGFREIWWWNIVGTGLIATMAVTVAGWLPASGWNRWHGIAVATLVFLLVPGLRLLAPPASSAENTYSVQEVAGLIERNVAHRLAERIETDAVVLAPPSLATSLAYYGSIKVLGTFMPENNEGMAAAGRIASAISPDEARNLMESRGVTHILVPSWDPFLDELARVGTSQPDRALIAALHRWAQPLWLRPVPFQLPTVGGFEGQNLVIFEKTAEPGEAVALSRQAEYFLETGRGDLAVQVALSLARFPADINALVARARVAKAANNTTELNTVLTTLVPLASYGLDRGLAWDRRLSLAVTLAQNERPTEARVQIERCLAEADDGKLRRLTTTSLYQLMVLTKAFQLDFADPALREFAVNLLPAGIRERI